MFFLISVSFFVFDITSIPLTINILLDNVKLIYACASSGNVDVTPIHSLILHEILY